jgi:(1->4)-alpha-D-glucan 1-alpha-D-glucosylmutase
MLTLSTHDTKRSADVRARLNVLSEIPDAWRAAVHGWAERNGRYRRDGWPDYNTEYLLYQTLVGAWPIDAERVVAFMAKATKEAKVHTSWVDPVAAYDDGLESFVRAVLVDEAFIADVDRFMTDERIVARGQQNSLAQAALLLTCPGVPDLYQGNELWDLSLVDPDNRRPVDYALRRRLLGELRDAGGPQAMAGAESGGPKLWLVHRLLAHRRRHPERYRSRRYEPLEVTGPRAEGVVGFARDGLAVMVPCRTATGWGDALIHLPPGRWTSLLTSGTVDGGTHPVDELLAEFPVGVFTKDGN